VLAAFWEAAGGKLADRWAAVSLPALVFWLGGLLAWAYDRGGLSNVPGVSWLERQTSAMQVVLLLAALVAVAASGAVVSWAATPVLRLLEGYWPAWTGPLRRRLCNWLTDRANADTDAWQRAQGRVEAAHPTAEDLAAYARLERRRRRRPADSAYFLPTPIGNRLRAAERRPADKYGLDPIAVWPHLWLLLPESTRTELRTARASLDSAVGTATWGLLFCAFTPFTWLALPIGLSVAGIAVAVVTPLRAQSFGDLIEAAFDLHRTDLYRQLRWPLPANPGEERGTGTAVTAYLWRGSDSPTPTFTPPAGP
jgi:hypothetical protein